MCVNNGDALEDISTLLEVGSRGRLQWEISAPWKRYTMLEDKHLHSGGKMMRHINVSNLI